MSSKERILILDEKTERALTVICDTALKFAGMQVASVVADIVDAIHEQDTEEDDW